MSRLIMSNQFVGLMYAKTMDQTKEAFNWKNTQPLKKQVGQQKGTILKFLDYRLQFVEAYQIIKVNDEGFNENLVELYSKPPLKTYVSNKTKNKSFDDAWNMDILHLND